MKKIVALAGGVGAARLLDGLARVVDPARLAVIGNTGDDVVLHGLHISPDLDSVTYMLAGLSDPARGWGLRGDTFRCLDALKTLRGEAWFHLGDRDLATHLFRTGMLQRGEPLSAVTSRIASALGVRAAIFPMSDDPAPTRILSRRGALDFQDYFVRLGARPSVLGVEYDGAARARPASGVLRSIETASAVVVCPSSPFISIGPILAVPGIRDALRKTAAPVAAISPIVAGRALKGPAARMMKSMGLRVSALGVAELYRDFVDIFVLDRLDARLAPEVEALGINPVVTNTIMSGPAQRKALARSVLSALGWRP